jgi:hypothetical protein
MNIKTTQQAGSESLEAFNRLENDVISVSKTLEETIALMDDLSDGGSKILSVMNEK